MAYDRTYQNITSNDDLIHFKGLNLDNELVSAQVDDVGLQNASSRAINDVELWLIDYINVNYDFNGDRSDLSDFQKEYFKRAVCEQIDYILDNGDLRSISGINRDTGVIIPPEILNKRELSPEAFWCLRRCGLANLRRC